MELYALVYIRERKQLANPNRWPRSHDGVRLVMYTAPLKYASTKHSSLRTEPVGQFIAFKQDGHHMA